VEINWIQHNNTNKPLLLSIYGHLNQDINNEAWGFGDIKITYYTEEEWRAATLSPTTSKPTIYPTLEPTSEPTTEPTQESTKYNPTYTPIPYVKPSKSGKGGINNKTTTYIAIGIFVGLICLIFITSYLIYVQRKKNSNNNNVNNSIQSR